MTITIQLDASLEQRLREHAARRGLDPDSYAVAAIREQLLRDPAETPHLRGEEADLLQQASLGFSTETWERYDSLVEKRDDGVLTSRELDELKDLTTQLETANVRRIEALSKLARLRNTTLESLMDELQIKPHERQSD